MLSRACRVAVTPSPPYGRILHYTHNVNGIFTSFLGCFAMFLHCADCQAVAAALCDIIRTIYIATAYKIDVFACLLPLRRFCVDTPRVLPAPPLSVDRQAARI